MCSRHALEQGTPISDLLRRFPVWILVIALGVADRALAILGQSYGGTGAGHAVQSPRFAPLSAVAIQHLFSSTTDARGCTSSEIGWSERGQGEGRIHGQSSVIWRNAFFVPIA